MPHSKKENLVFKGRVRPILAENGPIAILSIEIVNHSILDKTKILAKLKYIYRFLNRNITNSHGTAILIEGEESQPEKYELQTLLNELGSILFGPIYDIIDGSSDIEFIISEELIQIPFDILYYNEIPLFLQKPVLYSFDILDEQPFLVSTDWVGLMISDPTADPERGVLIAKKIFPNSWYFDTKKLSIKDIKEIKKSDFILISAHGTVNSKEEDFIAIKGAKLYPQVFSHLDPRFVYLDSCQLGISLDFIKFFRRNKTKYYIAPILSNEAGNSSTKTINWFFEAIKEGETPSDALFKTRKKLFKDFNKPDEFKSPNGFLKIIWRVFPFRVYRLN